MDRVNWMLILTFEVILVLEAERKKTFQVRFMVPHRLRLSPPLANHAASSLRLWFSFPSVFVDFIFLVATLNCHSRDFCGSTGADSSSVYMGTCAAPRPGGPGGRCVRRIKRNIRIIKESKSWW